MTQSTIKGRDLPERTFRFANDVKNLVKRVPDTIANREYSKQVIRSSGSVGANYIEADGALGKGDLLMKLRTSRRESRESRYWLRLLDVGSDRVVEVERIRLMQEAYELLLIFSSIIQKCS